MLRSVVRFSLRFRGAALALGVVVMVYGAYRLTQVSYDVFPRFAPPRVQIQTEAPGLTPQQVEQLVTLPVESVVNGAPGVDTMRSSSMQGLSLLTVIFDPGTDIYRDRQVISERLASLAGTLPVTAHAPVMTPLTSATGTVLVLGLTSDRL
ncbi:MAG TPA: efflux RND transporter permease subunit, partial [Gammaproteobacteria bacterium]|nr:efflux RND transporter permease subunit [Gammaproteobacteria bacterium]